MRYRAFISYSHKDARWASWLHRSLEGYRVPARLRGAAGAFGRLPDRLSPVFRDREDLASAGELGPTIEAALVQSEALIVVCSPASAHSTWVNQEIQHFKRTGRADRIFCLIVAGEPHAGDDQECFAPALLGIDSGHETMATQPIEPLAADVRPGKDGKALARVKLLAGLLGVELDRLRQREAARRHRRLLAVAALALLVAVTTSLLAFQAMVARDAAQRRQKQAEALVGFMLGDLNEKLAQVSRLDILESVNNQAMAYFKSIPATDLTDQSLEQRAQALVKIGNVRMDQGHLPDALDSYRAAETLAARLAATAPGDVDRQLAHADSLMYIGTAHWYQGELPKAQARFEAAQTVLRRTRALAPTDPRLMLQLSTLDNNIGHVLEARGQLGQARAHYQDMLGHVRELVATDPENRNWAAQLGLAHNNLAKMALLHGELAVAIDEYRKDVDIQRQLAADDPGDNVQAERLVWSRAALGRTLALGGHIDAGISQLRQSLAGAERLVALESGSTAFQEDRGLYATQLARLLRTTGNEVEAAALSRKGIHDLAALVGQSPDNPGWVRELAEARIEQAEQAAQARDRSRQARAKDQARQALAILEPLLQKQPDDRATVLATTRARLVLATVSDDAAAAQALREHSLSTTRAQSTGREDPRLLALQVESLLALGRRTDALALLPRLWRTGYRDPELSATLKRHGINSPPAVAPLPGPAKSTAEASFGD